MSVEPEGDVDATDESIASSNSDKAVQGCCFVDGKDPILTTQADCIDRGGVFVNGPCPSTP